MAEPIRFALMVSAHEVPGDTRVNADVSVQVWQGNQHISTVDVLYLSDLPLSSADDKTTCEGYALSALRALLQHTTDEYSKRLDAGDCYPRTSWEVVGSEAAR